MITHLSFSRLKALAESPRELRAYLERDKEPTKAMIMGSLVDCLLFEPEKIEARYYVMPEIVAITKDGRIAENPLQTADGKAQLAHHRDQAIASGRILISQAEYDAAKAEAEAVRENSVVQRAGLLEGASFQYGFEREMSANGGMPWKYRGVLDVYAKRRHICDLKRVSNASDPRLLKRNILSSLYHMQAAIYLDAVGENIPYYIIAVDSHRSVTVVRLSDDTLEQGRALWAKLEARLSLVREATAFMSDIDAEIEWLTFLNQGIECWADEPSTGVFIL